MMNFLNNLSDIQEKRRNSLTKLTPCKFDSLTLDEDMLASDQLIFELTERKNKKHIHKYFNKTDQRESEVGNKI
jgi:hypothetical protein